MLFRPCPCTSVGPRNKIAHILRPRRVTANNSVRHAIITLCTSNGTSESRPDPSRAGRSPAAAAVDRPVGFYTHSKNAPGSRIEHTHTHARARSRVLGCKYTRTEAPGTMSTICDPFFGATVRICVYLYTYVPPARAEKRVNYTTARRIVHVYTHTHTHARERIE